MRLQLHIDMLLLPLSMPNSEYAESYTESLAKSNAAPYAESFAEPHAKSHKRIADGLSFYIAYLITYCIANNHVLSRIGTGGSAARGVLCWQEQRGREPAPHGRGVLPQDLLFFA
jgi:hypothetical protein